MKKFLVFSLLFGVFFFTGCSQKRYDLSNPSRNKATMRPYKVLGKRYRPTYVSVGDVMKGTSSWYGPNFHGKYTSNGEVYNMYAKTAAHKTWPMNTMVRVTNLQNGKSTIVRINDRGPFVRGRIIDCSYTAGKELGLDKMGIARVSLEIVGFSGKVESSARIKRDIKENKIKRIHLSNFGIQVGAFRRYEGAKHIRDTYANRYENHKTIIKRFIVDDEPLYRIWLMGFSSEEEADDFKNSHNLYGAFTVRN